MKRKNNFSIDYQFVPRPIEMMQTPAYHRLRLTARRILDCLDIAYNKAPSANGRLRVTWQQFVEYGVRKKSIKPALKELVAAGILKVANWGRNSPFIQFRHVAEYGLTYRPIAGAPPTHDWKRPHSRTSSREGAKRYQSDGGETLPISPGRLAKMPIKAGGETLPPVDCSPRASPSRRAEEEEGLAPASAATTTPSSDSTATASAPATATVIATATPAYAVVRPLPRKWSLAPDAMATYYVDRPWPIVTTNPTCAHCHVADEKVHKAAGRWYPNGGVYLHRWCRQPWLNQNRKAAVA